MEINNASLYINIHIIKKRAGKILTHNTLTFPNIPLLSFNKYKYKRTVKYAVTLLRY